MPEKICPRCQQPMNRDAKSGFWISACGYKVPETLEEARTRMQAKGSRPQVAISFRGTIDPRAMSVFETAHDHLWNGDKEGAIKSMRQTLDLQPEFVDPYVWLAKLCDDPRDQRNYLEEALARDAGNLEALRLLMVMNGEMTAEEAARSAGANDPRRVEVDEAVKASTQTLICPVCGGGLTVDEQSGRVVCRFCGYLQPMEKKRSSKEGSSLGAALLKRRGQAVQWVIGKRLLHCKQCGTDRTIPATQLSHVCPFCGANAVIESDALKTVEQPDTILPFLFNEDQAKTVIRERLKKLDQKLAGLLDDNRVDRALLDGLYLPLWVFDALVKVSQTTFDQRTPNSREQARTFKPYQNIEFQDGMVGVGVFGMKQPPLLDEISEYNLSAAEAYEPKRLARYPAALYDVDFDAASLTARSRISALMRQRYERSDNGSVTVNAYANIVQMSFSLMLAPVWIATLYERDGEIRSAVVNGQTGEIALGKAHKP